MEENKTSKIVGVVVAVIIGILLLIWLIVSMTNNKKDDAMLKNAENNAVNGTENVAGDVVNGTKNVAGDIVNGTKEVAEDIKDGILKVFDINNRENVSITDGMKTNTSEKFKEVRTIESLTFSNATLIGKNTGATFKFDVKNNSSIDFSKRTLIVRFADKNGNEIGSSNVEIPDIKIGEQKSIETRIMADIANAYDYTISTK